MYNPYNFGENNMQSTKSLSERRKGIFIVSN